MAFGDGPALLRPTSPRLSAVAPEGRLSPCVELIPRPNTAINSYVTVG